MSYESKPLSEIKEELGRRGPSALCGDAAALAVSLALYLAGEGGRPKLTVLKFGEAADKERDEPEARSGVLAARLAELAEADREAEDNIRAALRKPPLAPAGAEKRNEALEEAYWAAGSVTLNLMRSVSEAAALISKAVNTASALERASAASSLALCLGALRALEIEALARASYLGETRRNSLRRSASLLREDCERSALEALEELRGGFLQP
ncbi:MAG: cyclodeaminase/cyclohydrolase family protein [Oscillospiraceae bacterium]|nr:cyclodeaminase/cyclohydrolase family protein [Oscillospiraceae bacterium]